jgi:hypothetical protein
VQLSSGSIIALVAAILIAYAVILWLGTILWAYRDIRERTRDSLSQTVAVALVGIFNIPGLILYLILRPHETMAEAYERRMEAEVLLADARESHSCPACMRATRDDFVVCPHCRTKLREACTGCRRLLELSWAACPYCGKPGPQPMTQPAGVMSEMHASAQSPYWTPGPGERRAPEAPATSTPPSPQ